jgi:outer membrane protein
MKKTLTTILIALCFSAFAQVKLGHINTQELIRLMPEVELADQAFATEFRIIQNSLQTMSEEFERLANEFQANQNQWSQLIQQTRVREIQDLQGRIENFRENAERELEELRASLFQPIIEKAREAVAEVAREHKYTYIFDLSTGPLAYYGGDDIMELVKKKLNLK